ncbi:MAG: hypothetical protein DRN04_09850 [Thermoprotei archaeon]|nr:MAG: hypothetical protein DRN04_09850 [Thermoprotei archaeon]
MKLKEEILRLLREDIEFRYTVLGYLGLDEVVKSIHDLQRQVAEQSKAIYNLQKQVYEHTKIISNLQKEVVKYGKLLEKHEKIIEELKTEVKELKTEVRELKGDVQGLKAAFIELRSAMGLTLEEFSRSFLRGLLEARGIPKDKLKLERKVFKLDSREIEINIFNENPLIVAEVTAVLEDLSELDKVLERVLLVEGIYGRKPDYVFLITPTITRNLSEEVFKKAKEYGIEIIYGKIA